MKFSKEAKVGIFAIITIAILYLGFNFLKGIDFFKPTKRYYAVYEDVAGLNESNPVKINGFTVGRVSDIRIMQERDNDILVVLDVSDDIILGDSTIALLDVDLLGSVSIVLNVGPIGEPFESGDTLRSELAKGLQEILIEGALPVADNLQSTIRRINTILDNLSGSSDRINNIIKNIDETLESVNGITNENRGSLRELLEKTGPLLDTLTYTVANINPVIENYGSLADSLKSIDIQTTLEKTNDALEGMNEFMVKLNEGEGTLNKLMTNDSLYNNLNKSLEDLDRLLIHMNENPKHFFAPLGKSKKKIERDRRREAKKAAN